MPFHFAVFILKMAADGEISQLNRGSTTSKVGRKTWSSQPAEVEGDEEKQLPRVKFLSPEGESPSPQLRCFESDDSFTHEAAEETSPSDATRPHLSLSFDTSQASIRSTDTTLEYYDAPLSEDHRGTQSHTGADDDDDDVVTVNNKSVFKMEEPEENPETSTEQNLQLLSEDSEKEEEGNRLSEEEIESAPNVEANDEEKAVDSKREEDQIIVSNSEQEDIATVTQEEPLHSKGGLFFFICDIFLMWNMHKLDVK